MSIARATKVVSDGWRSSLGHLCFDSLTDTTTFGRPFLKPHDSRAWELFRLAIFGLQVYSHPFWEQTTRCPLPFPQNQSHMLILLLVRWVTVSQSTVHLNLFHTLPAPLSSLCFQSPGCQDGNSGLKLSFSQHVPRYSFPLFRTTLVARQTATMPPDYLFGRIAQADHRCLKWAGTWWCLAMFRHVFAVFPQLYKAWAVCYNGTKSVRLAGSKQTTWWACE